MSHLNIEVKARCGEVDHARAALHARQVEFIGVDHQRDTYFSCPTGRLKLREGTIERSLIHYARADEVGARASRVTLHHVVGDIEGLHQVLSNALEVLVVVDKRREIYLAGNVKLHLDEVVGLGTFVEIEARDSDGVLDEARLRYQCDEWIALLGIQPRDVVAESYSDLVLAARRS